MNKEQIEICREIVRMFDKVSFTISAVEMIKFSQKLSAFSKFIMEEEKNLMQATMNSLAEEKKELLKLNPRRKKEVKKEIANE